jgi:hypothetical protein
MINYRSSITHEVKTKKGGKKRIRLLNTTGSWPFAEPYYRSEYSQITILANATTYITVRIVIASLLPLSEATLYPVLHHGGDY